MFKAVVLIKRKNGITMEQFISHYENSHAPLGAGIIENLKKYKRTYISLFSGDAYAASGELPYDVVTEVWFENKDEFLRGMQRLAEPESAAILAADEEIAFDRSSIRFAIADERETIFELN